MKKHTRQECALILFCLLAGGTAAFFIFLSASAGAGVVGADFLALSHGSAFFASVGGAAFTCDFGSILFEK